MRKIVWTDEAIAHLDAIIAYISAFNPAAAARLGERLIATADCLAEFSERGRDAGEGRREMTTVWPYVCGGGCGDHPAHSAWGTG